MAKFILGYGGKWQEELDDRETAIARAKAVAAEEGVTVEVVRKSFGLHSFVTGFPESEAKALKARWRVIPNLQSVMGGANGGGGHHYSSIGGHGGHGGGGGHHGGGHGGGF